MQFLCMLKTSAMGITFWFFLEDHSINWNNLRMMIGFNSKCVIGLDSVVPTFNKNGFPLKNSRLSKLIQLHHEHQ